MKLSATEALGLRMRSLLLDGSAPRFDSVAGVVEWFGAMQAQDLGSGLWSLGVRLPDFTIADVRAGLERREALRTWPMRGTVHFVPARDARWMLELTGVKALAGAEYRRRNNGLDEATANRAVDALAAALTGGNQLTRAKCLAAIEQAGITTTAQRGYHLLWYASQLGVTCIGPNIGTEQTFVLLDEWAPNPNRPDREEAMATLATRYFRSHGPATLKDFAGWTGFGLGEARTAIAAAGPDVVPVEVDGTEMFAGPQAAGIGPATGVLVLPGFDEYLLGYKDRSLMVADDHVQAIVPGGNGMFRATIVRDGRVVGTWKRKSASKTKTVLDVMPLVTLRKRDHAAIAKAFEGYERYLGQRVEFG
ncbi:winged helix DNA-binding domain-containing protein [Skermania sp. ID1734]|uniref:winged helix DNA-binding domain-containing protein n=1 Tax=Skermania sp. ID1734 TaxID=2597516 RepID=UPI0021023944|nr:winged helix DNA-binding domain-containing protein [Skermania sp. ID1734]